MTKIYVVAALMLMAVAAIGFVADLEGGDAVTEYPVTVYYHPNATIVFDGVTVTYPNNAEPYGYGDQITITATLATGYTFDHWYGNNITEGEDWTANSSSPDISISGNVVTYTTYCYGEEEYTLYLSGGVTPTYSITFVNNDHDYGSLSTYLISNVPYGAHWTTSSKTFTIINSNPFVYSKCTATANPKSGAYQYAFDGWSYIGSGTVTDDMTVTAYFSRSTAEYTVTFASSGNGSVSPATIPHVPYGTAITASSNTVTINGTTATATPHAATTYYNYYFDSWDDAAGTVTGDLTITANFIQAPKNFPVTVYYHPNATIYADFQEVPQAGWADETAYGGLIHLSAVIDEGYTFDYWYGNNITEGEDWHATSSSEGVTVTGQVVTYETYCYGEEEYTLVLSGGVPTTYTVTFQVSPAGYGSLSSYSVTAEYGDPYSHSGSIFNVGGTLVLASPAPSDTSYTYAFDEWSTQPSGTVTSDMTVTAYFTRSPVIYEDGTYWTNDNYNGRMDILFKFDSTNNKTHTLDMDLLIGNVNSDQSTTWAASPYSLEVELSYPSLQVTVTLSWSSLNVTKTVTMGSWSTFVLTIDTDKGTVMVTPVRTFENFTSFTLYDKQVKTVLDFSDKITGAAVHDVRHTESVNGTNSPTFSVVGTSVFLNTFGVVLYNPTINLYDYFPQYNAIRVNFYSFALYGDSITINGITWPVNGSKITVQYVTDGSDHFLPGVMPNATVQTRTFELTNIYVTYQDGHCYLTFVNDRFTLDLGTYTAGNETISMSGLWYFATMVYEPYTATEKHLSDWKILPETDSSQMVLIFIAILILAGAAVAIHARKSGLGIIDLVIIGGALIIGLVLLG